MFSWNRVAVFLLVAASLYIINFDSYNKAIYWLWLFHSESWISIAESVDLRSFSGNWSAEAPLVVGLLTLNSLKSLVKLPSSTFTRLGIYYQWTRIKNEVSYVYNFFICFYVPQVAQTTWLRRHPAWSFTVFSWNWVAVILLVTASLCIINFGS